ncbi:MAG: glycosyltransferase [Patescibacteria group bacterium]
MKPIELSLILTLYNEGPTLPASLGRIYNLLNQSGLVYEIIIIDDRGQDESCALAQDFCLKQDNCQLYQNAVNLGRGGAVSRGMRMAKGRVVGFIDTDLELSPERIPEAARMILKGEVDVVTGKRNYTFGPASHLRWILTKGYHELVRLILNLPLKDTETGFKFFNREKIQPVLEKVQDKRWFWDTEIMARSFNAGLKIKEIEVLYKRKMDKKTSVRFFRDSLAYLGKLVRFKFKKK